MSLHFAALPVTNATSLCVGGITRSEAELVKEEGHEIGDGSGYYLFFANETEPAKPIQILAKFFSAAEAEAFARALSGRGA